VTDEVLRNGVPHNVTTSLVTHNAVLPQNIFIKDEASALRDSGMGDVVPSLVNRDSSSEVNLTSSKPAPQAEPNYPVSNDKLAANDTLTNIKSHIRDNIQALKNLAHADNRQTVTADEFNQNIQSLGASRSIEENKLYLEKKSITSNRQLISKTTTERSDPNLVIPNRASHSGLDSDECETQATEIKTSDKSLKDKKMSNKDSAFQMRVKKLKKQVRNVDSTLQNLEADK
jgi:hypothetical protein